MQEHTIYVTATEVTPGTDENDYAEAHGWISPTWSRFALYKDRDPVSPAFYGSGRMSNADIAHAVDSMSEWVPYIDHTEVGPSGTSATFYGTDRSPCSDHELRTGKSYTYACHAQGSASFISRLLAALGQ